MSWGGLNPALTSWRNGILARFPDRGTQSDGGYADAAHGSSSQHQPDFDGTVDAFDCDVNFFGSGTPTGTADERRVAEAVKADFAADPRSQLWIHRREIADRDNGPWRERRYAGDNPHDRHIHFQSRQSRERDGRRWPMPRTDALIEELTMPSAQEIADAVWGKEFTLPDGRRLTAATIMRWLGATELDTRNKILGAIADEVLPPLQRIESAVTPSAPADRPADAPS